MIPNVIIMGDAMLASNPWKPAKRFRTITPPHYSPSQALDDITYFLRQWDGDATVTLDIQERHTRFIQIIGGYPSINGRFPLDWPLHSDSSRALNLSRYLDTLQGTARTSLRSIILDLDQVERAKPEGERTEKTWREVNRRCVSKLLHVLRKNDNPNNDDFSKFSVSEERFLRNLHSLDSNRLGESWPWAFDEDAQEGWEKPQPPAEPPLTPEQKLFIADYFNNGKPSEDKKKVEKYQSITHEWKHHNEKEKAWKTTHPDYNNYEVVRFEYYYIQKWMNRQWLAHWLDYDADQNDSLGQRLLRGLSAICELGISRIRERIIREFGLGAILIDGGGRIEVAVPKAKVQAAIKTMKNSFENMFMLSGGGGKESYLQTEIRDSLINHIGSNVWEKTPPGERSGLFAEHLGPEFVNKAMPPRLIYKVEKQSLNDEENNKHHPYIIDSNPDSNCCICSKDPKMDWTKLDRYSTTAHVQNTLLKTSDDVVAPQKNSKQKRSFCMMHRLAYIVGHNQRLRDSVRNSAEHRDLVSPMGYEVGSRRLGPEKAQKLRAVHSVCVLDGNGIGRILRGEDQSHLDFDIRRRKSFRFNSTWFSALSNSLTDIGSFGADRVAAWVCAGDDLVLAQYGDKDLNQPMNSFLEKLDENIRIEFDEISPFILTFAGGHALRKQGDKNLRIRGTYKEALKFEKVAKNYWKTKAKKDYEEYLQRWDETLRVDFLETSNIWGDFTEYSSRKLCRLLPFRKKLTPPHSLVVRSLMESEENQKMLDKMNESGSDKERLVEVWVNDAKVLKDYNLYVERKAAEIEEE